MRKSPIFWTVLSGLRMAAAIAACMPVGAAFGQSSPPEATSPSTGHGPGNGQGAGQGGGRGGAGQTTGQPSSGGYAGGGYSGQGGAKGGPGGREGGHGGYGDMHGHDFHGGFHAGGFDRSNPRWWQGRREFNGYAGHRPGFFFAPGFGYRPFPSGYAGRPWVVGVVVPPELRSYQVTDPTVYGVAPAPVGHRWIYVDDGVALIDTSRGVIVQSVSHIW